MELIYKEIIEIFKSPFSQTFISSFVSACAGAYAGARFAIKFQSKKELKEQIKIEKGLVNYCLVSLACNLENLINFKKQTLLPLLVEVEKIKSDPKIKKVIELGMQPVEEVMQSPVKIKELAKLQTSLRFLSLPDMERLSTISEKRPNLIRLSYKVNETLIDINWIIDQLNNNFSKLTEHHPLINIQYLILRISLAENIVQETDDALFFINKATNLFYEVCDEKFKEKRKGIYEIKLLEEYQDLLPPDDRVKGF